MEKIEFLKILLVSSAAEYLKGINAINRSM
jgi:hypothetical protein